VHRRRLAQRHGKVGAPDRSEAPINKGVHPPFININSVLS
jgi:hypothetical protein